MKRVIQRGFNKRPDEVKVEDGSLLDRIEDELKDEGIHLFDNQDIEEKYLRLPADITRVTDKELGTYFSMFTAQKAWTRTLIGRMRILLREMGEELEDIKSNVYSGLPAKMSVTEKELNLRTHAKYGTRAKELIQDLAFKSEKLGILNDYLESLVDVLFVISREITRRNGDNNTDNREHSIGNKRR
jgi:hypothetical protein